MMKIPLIILYIVAMVVIGAVSDGLFDDGLKVWGHALGALEVAMLFSFAFIFRLEWKVFLVVGLSYLFIRIACFDITYNIVRDLPILQIGTTSLWDNFISKIPPYGMVFARSIFLIAGIAIPIKEL